jgi:hypothetical protein
MTPTPAPFNCNNWPEKAGCLCRSAAAVIEGTFCRVEYNSDRVAIEVPPEFNLKP